jgi:hypothetical protein
LVKKEKKIEKQKHTPHTHALRPHARRSTLTHACTAERVLLLAACWSLVHATGRHFLLRVCLARENF